MGQAVDPIRIDGLRDLQAALKALDGESQKALRGALNGAAALVVGKAKGSVPVKSGAALASLKASSSQREARVGFGSAKAPYAPWLDYGGAVGRKKATLRPFVKTGRIVYPAYNAERPAVMAELAAALHAVTVKAGLEVET